MAYTTKKVTFVLLYKKDITLHGFWPKASVEKLLEQMNYKVFFHVTHTLINYSKPHLTETINNFKFKHD